MSETETRETDGVVDDCGVILCAEACGEGIPGLGRFAVHAVDEGWDGGCGGWGRGWGNLGLVEGKGVIEVVWCCGGVSWYGVVEQEK